MYKEQTVYFPEKGKANTDETLKAAKERADKLGIRNIVVATTGGETGLKAAEFFKGYNVVLVTHVTGMREPGVQQVSSDTARKIAEAGGKIVTAAHTFSGVNSAIQRKFNTVYPPAIIAQTLRMFGQGMKVCVEIAAMATDAGAITPDKDAVVIAGSGRGSDTAVVLRPANSHNLFDTVVKEIIAKPSNPL